MIETIKPEHFRSLKLASDAVVIDVRAAKEQQEEGEIPGNIRIQLGTPAFEEEVKQLEKDRRYLLYCRTGVRSMEACQTMNRLGFDQVYSLDGGIVKWKETFNN